MARRSWRLVPGRHTFRRCALLVIGVVVAAMVLRWMERSTPEDDTAVDDIASASLAPAEDDKVDEDRVRETAHGPRACHGLQLTPALGVGRPARSRVGPCRIKGGPVHPVVRRRDSAGASKRARAGAGRKPRE